MPPPFAIRLRQLPRRLNQRLRDGVALCLVAAAPLFLHAQTEGTPAVAGQLTSPDAIWTLPASEKSATFSLNAEVHVDYYDPEWKLLWTHHGDEAMYIPLGPKPLPIRTGQRVAINGTVIPNEGLSGDKVTITVLAENEPIPAIELGDDLPRIATLNARRVRVKALVGAVEETDAKHLHLQLAFPQKPVFAWLRVEDSDLIPDFSNSFVELEGLVIVTPDPTGKLAHAEIWVGSVKDIQVLSTLEEDPRFKLPSVSIEALQEHAADQVIRVAGTVNAIQPGGLLTLRDETGQLELQTSQPIDVKVGESIEAFGHPVRHDPSWRLEHSFFRRIQSNRGPNSVERAGARRPKLHLADQVISLTPQDAATGIPAKITGVVTWSNRKAPFFFLSDSSGSVRVELPSGDGPASVPPETGARIKVNAVTAEGSYAPMLKASGFEDSGKSGLPEIASTTIEQALTGVLENRLVSLEGYVRDLNHSGPWMNLELLTSGGKFTAVVPWDPALTHLRGSVVSIRGICTAVTDENRQLTGVKLWANNAQDITTEDPAPADPFSIPSRPIASLRRFSTMKQLNRRVRVSGTVIQAVDHRELAIQDDTSTLRIFLADTADVALGELVDVVGFPSRDDASVFLHECVVRSLGKGVEPVPVELSTLDAARPDLDGRVVTLTGKLLDLFSSDGLLRLTLQGGNSTFEANLAGPSAEWLKRHLQPGAEVSLVGVYEVQPGKDHHARRFAIGLRSEKDVRVLKEPSWWNTDRSLRAAGVAGLALCLGLGWAVTLRRRVRAQTRQLRAQWETELQLKKQHNDILENASDFIYTVDSSGRFTSFNAAGETLTGYSRDEALKLTLRDLIAPATDSSDNTNNDDATQGRLITKDGRTLWVETSSREIREGEQLVGELGIVRDISKRKQIEQELTRARDAAEATAKSKSAFLANMSHEIRTPMNGVIGMCNLLLDTRLSTEQKDFAETIRHSAEALLTVLNDILDFSKIEAGKLRFELIDFDLRDVFEGTIDLLAPRASSKNLELSLFAPTELPTRLTGDPGRLRQVLLNLVGNAIKFTEAGEVSINISTLSVDDASAVLRVEVSDTGIGMAPEAQQRLFAPFCQADESTTRRFGGTGLGLVISKQIVELMDGEIGVRSEVGKGSTFWFTVKLARQPRGGTVPPLEQLGHLRGKRVLIVDDNATNRRIVRHYLDQHGMNSTDATGGPEALRALRAAKEAGQEFDLVLCDYQMPEMDGMMVCRTIHDDPAFDQLPLIILTSLDRRVSGTELGACGIAEMLSKPIRRQQLVASVARALLRPDADAAKTAMQARSEPAQSADIFGSAEDRSRVLRVLVAEDNVVNQRVTLFQLRKLGHKVEIASDGLEVLEALERSEFDVILMDCQMPEMDGYETTRRIRANSRHAKIRIVAMTANAMKGDREVCLAAGMDDYVSKPTAPADLAAALKRVPLGFRAAV
ncbi:MAG TPA: response regulator [Opitutaceae bacterium]|nr:response regulator [Opitutaceae bacterium]